jgi:L-proline amide hydrolase
MSDIATREGYIDFHGYQTWFKVVGDLSSPLTPLVTLHGGPGCSHLYLQTMDQLAEDGRAVIFYDQLGCGKSTDLRHQPADFWTIDLFLDEMNSVLTTLGVADDYHLFGQSWGGMLGAEHAVRAPTGLRSLIISNALPSSESWTRGAKRLRSLLPPEVEAALDRHEAAGTETDPEYVAAADVYYGRHVCRIPMPEHVAKSFALLSENPSVYGSMWGNYEFSPTGSLRDWSIVERLSQIAVPTLVIAGEYDEATSETQEIFVAEIPDVRQVVVPDASHMAIVEQPELYFAALRDFLAEVD